MKFLFQKRKKSLFNRSKVLYSLDFKESYIVSYKKTTLFVNILLINLTFQ